MKPTRHGREIFYAHCDVVRRLLKHRAALVLWKRPPFGRLSNRNERSAGRLGSVEGWLQFGQTLFLRPRDVALVAPNTTQNPGRIAMAVGQSALYEKPR